MFASGGGVEFPIYVLLNIAFLVSFDLNSSPQASARYWDLSFWFGVRYEYWQRWMESWNDDMVVDGDEDVLNDEAPRARESVNA